MMNTVWKNIKLYTKKFFDLVFSSWKNFLIFFLLIVSVFLFFNYRSVKSDYDNIVIENSDTLTVYKNKLGELYSERSVYITDNENLKKSNTELYKEIQSLKDDPIVVTKIKTVIEYKEIVVTDTITVVEPNIYTSNITYDDSWCHIKGNSMFDLNKGLSTTTLDSIAFTNNLTVDLLDKDSNLSIVVKSDNPYCKINNIEGAVISPEKSKALKKRFEEHWVVVAGLGGSLVPVNGTVKFLPGVNVTFGYKLFGF